MYLRYYEILKASKREELEQKVNDMTDAGFTPIGGICVLTGNDCSWTEFYQAVMRKEKISDESS